MNNIQKCRVCGSNDFYKEAGYFFCQTCQTQSEDIREEVFELNVGHNTRVRKTKIRQARSDKSGDGAGWTSWELYNFILIGLTDELIGLGVPSDIKMTILQLWATYLGKIEVAFISTKKKCVPKLAKRYNKSDAEIIYGKAQSSKGSSKRRRVGSSTNTSVISSTYQSEGSSSRELVKNKRLLINADYDNYLQSQASSGADSRSLFSQSVHSFQTSSGKSSNYEASVFRLQYSSHAKEETKKVLRLSKNVPSGRRTKYIEKHVSTKYAMGPNVITPLKLWAIIYIALRIHDQPIQIGDMLRYGREGHLSYYKLDHLLPPEINLTKCKTNFLSQNIEITHKGMRRIIASMAKLLGVSDLRCPDFQSLISRYCTELGLPRGIQLYAERLVALSPPKMTFDIKKSYIPNYEGRAIAFIVVVLKTLLALDDITEYHISRVAEKINSVASERRLRVEKLFSFQEWQRYVECRKTILVHSHFPTKIKYSPDSHGIDDLYIKFLEATTSKADKKEPDTKNSRHFLPEELIAAMSNYVTRLNFNETPEKLTESFPPSLTPLHSYLQHLLNRPLADIPRVIRSDFFLTKVGYLTKPNSLAELATKLDIEIGVCDSNLHFVEKVVLPFEQPRMPSVEELKQLVDVQDDSENKPVKISETLNDYMHRNVPCKVKLDVTKQQYYNSIRSLASSVKNIDTEEFMFTETLPNGKLDIPDDSEDEDKEKDVGLIASINQEHILSGKKFCDEYNLQLSLAEKESVCKSDILKQIRLRQAFRPMRNPKGQFIKGKIPVEVEESMNDFSPKENDLIAHSTQISSREEMFTGVESVADEKLSTSGSLNMTINDGDIEAAFSYLDDYFNLGEISIFGENNDVPQENEKSINNTRYQLFRPFKDYWMHHCIFSRVKPKNFAAFEKSLPRNFRWVLNECAHVVEMPVEDLYEEICLIETYLAHVLKPSSEEAPINVDPIAKSQLKFTLSKW